MRIKALHPNFVKPIAHPDIEGVYDLFMPDEGMAVPSLVKTIDLGFAADLEDNHLALVRVNPVVAAARGLELASGVAWFGSGDHRPWKVKLRTRAGSGQFAWDADAQLLQMTLIDLAQTRIEEVTDFL